MSLKLDFSLYWVVYSLSDSHLQQASRTRLAVGICCPVVLLLYYEISEFLSSLVLQTYLPMGEHLHKNMDRFTDAGSTDLHIGCRGKLEMLLLFMIHVNLKASIGYDILHLQVTS